MARTQNGNSDQRRNPDSNANAPLGEAVMEGQRRILALPWCASFSPKKPGWSNTALKTGSPFLPRNFLSAFHRAFGDSLAFQRLISLVGANRILGGIIPDSKLRSGRCG